MGNRNNGCGSQKGFQPGRRGDGKPRCLTLRELLADCLYNWPLAPIMAYNGRINARSLEQGLIRGGIPRPISEEGAREVIRGRNPKALYDQVKEARNDKIRAAIVNCAVWGAFTGATAAAIFAALGDANWKTIAGSSMVTCLTAALGEKLAAASKRIADRWRYGKGPRPPEVAKRAMIATP